MNISILIYLGLEYLKMVAALLQMIWAWGKLYKR